MTEDGNEENRDTMHHNNSTVITSVNAFNIHDSNTGFEYEFRVCIYLSLTRLDSRCVINECVL